jgi:hypothetical protein
MVIHFIFMISKQTVATLSNQTKIAKCAKSHVRLKTGRVLACGEPEAVAEPVCVLREECSEGRSKSAREAAACGCKNEPWRGNPEAVAVVVGVCARIGAHAVGGGCSGTEPAVFSIGIDLKKKRSFTCKILINNLTHRIKTRLGFEPMTSTKYRCHTITPVNLTVGW